MITCLMGAGEISQESMRWNAQLAHASAASEKNAVDAPVKPHLSRGARIHRGGKCSTRHVS
jgi:hypothetical protein